METKDLRELIDQELDHVAGGSAIHQGSGKNPSGNKVGPFEGNPHDQPGANGKNFP